MIGRFFRIVPVYLLCLAAGGWVALSFTPWLLHHAAWQGCDYFNRIVAPLSGSEQQHFGAHVFWHLLLLHSMIPNQILPASAGALLSPAWSISLEWQYYLVAPLIARMVKSLWGFLVLVLVVLVASKLGGTFIRAGVAILPDHLDMFLIGIGSYHLYARMQRATHTSLGTMLVIAAVAVATLGHFHSLSLEIWIIVFGANFLARKDLLSRCLAAPRALLLHPVSQLLGKWSYPLYLIHWPIIILCLSFLVSHFQGIRTQAVIPVLLAAGLPLAVASAALLHYLVEGPMMRWGRKFSHQKPVPSAHVPKFS